MRGKHTTTCKSGRKTIATLQAIAGVKAVIIGRSIGGKGLHNAFDGAIKLQKSVTGGISAVMQTSKGVQNIVILLENGIDDHAMRQKIIDNMSSLQ